MKVDKVKRPSKLKRLLLTFGERSLNRFEAERMADDHCLNSSVAVLRNRYGVEIDREWEVVPGWQGIETRVIRYSISEENKETAMQVANFLLR